MDSLKDLNNINLDIKFEEEKDINQISNNSAITLDNIKYKDNEYDFENTLQINIDEVNNDN